MAGFADKPEFRKAGGDNFSAGLEADDNLSIRFRVSTFESALEWFDQRIRPYLLSSEALGIEPCWGRLAHVAQGSGKRRCYRQRFSINACLPRSIGF